MRQQMYVAPMGRPISSPPSDNSNDDTPPVAKQTRRRVTDDERARWLADRATGMSYEAIAEKHGRSIATVYGVCVGRVRGNATPKPKRRPGESKQQYGGRIIAWKLANDPEFRERRAAATSRGVKAYWRKKRRAAEREAIVALEDAAMHVANQVAPPPSRWVRWMRWLTGQA